MERSAFATENALRDGIVRVLDAVRDSILYVKWYRPLLREKDPQKLLEKRLLFELSGVRQGGMAASGAYVSFKKDYYDRLPSHKDKSDARKTLLGMLRSERYSVSQRQSIASVCSDLGMDEASADIALVREAVARGMSMRQLFRYKRTRARELRRHNLG